MFDGTLPEVADLDALSTRELIDAARGWARAENAAAARKLAVMAEVFTRRTCCTAAQRQDWWVDPDAAVAAELAAALQLTQGLALHQTHRGVTLRDRLPQVAALFEEGAVSDLLVRKIVYRTGLITDPGLMAAVDSALARQLHRWGPLSEKKIEQAIDATVIMHDPAAERRVIPTAIDCTVEFGAPTDAPGFTSVWARMLAADAAALEERVNCIAGGVCAADPRGIAERRSAAFTAIAAGLDRIACRCGTSDCEASAATEGLARNTTVYLVVDAETVEQASANPAPEAAREPAVKPALVIGAGMLPAPLLDPMLARARLRRIVHPGNAAAEDRYTPSRALAEFVRCRDLTCRFPGCDRPATEADIDHTVAWPAGPTHASNMKCLCRFHHLLKTFWNGPDGWRDRQLPDGIVIWTGPTGHNYTTYPGSLTLFPTLCRPTAVLWDGDPPDPRICDGRAVMMPRRRHTRADNRARAIAAARRLNGAHADVTTPPF